MVDLVLRPSTLVEGKPFALQLRWHDSLGETEYYTIARVSEGLAEDIIRSGAPHWLFNEPSEIGKDLKAEIAALRQSLADAAPVLAEIDAVAHLAAAPTPDQKER